MSAYPCPECGGTGSDYDGGPGSCYSCGGFGEVAASKRNAIKYFYHDRREEGRRGVGTEGLPRPTYPDEPQEMTDVLGPRPPGTRKRRG